jgi:hypothetical protein
MPCGSAMGQHAGDGSSRSARRASTGEICAGILRMGRCAPPQDSVLLSPEYYAGTPRDGSRPARRAGAAPCCVVGEKRKARGRAARCAMGGSTTLFRAVFWVLPHPCFPAYSLYIEPKSWPDRALSWRDMSTLHRMTWWCVESTGLNHLWGTMSARAHDAVTLAYLRWKPVTCPRLVRSRARRPQTLVFSLVSFYHRGAEELSCTRM